MNINVAGDVDVSVTGIVDVHGNGNDNYNDNNNVVIVNGNGYGNNNSNSNAHGDGDGDGDGDSDGDGDGDDKHIRLLASCLELLKKSKRNDSEMFAGIVYTTHCIAVTSNAASTSTSTTTAAAASIIYEIFKAIDCKFLHRLLTTDVMSCSGDMPLEKRLELQSIALQLLALLSEYNDVLHDERMIDFIGDVVCWMKDYGDGSDEAMEKALCFMYQHVKLQRLTSRSLVAVLTCISRRPSVSVLEAAISVLSMVSLECYMSCSDVSNDEIISAMNDALPVIANYFAQSDSECKFTSAVVMEIMLSFPLNDDDAFTCFTSIADGIYNLLQARLGHEQRVVVLKLANSLLRCQCFNTLQVLFLILLVHTVGVELRMQLEVDNTVATYDEGLLEACFGLLESICILSSHDDTYGADDKLAGALADAVKPVVEQLCSRQTLYMDNENGGYIYDNYDNLVLAGVRVLGAWLTGSPGAEVLREPLKAVLPHLLEQRYMDFLLPGLCHVTADDDLRCVFIKAGGVKHVLAVFETNVIAACGVLLNIAVLDAPVLQPYMETILPLVAATEGTSRLHATVLVLFLISSASCTSSSRMQTSFVCGALDVLALWQSDSNELDAWFLGMQALASCAATFREALVLCDLSWINGYKSNSEKEQMQRTVAFRNVKAALKLTS